MRGQALREPSVCGARPQDLPALTHSHSESLASRPSPASPLLICLPMLWWSPLSLGGDLVPAHTKDLCFFLSHMQPSYSYPPTNPPPYPPTNSPLRPRSVPKTLADSFMPLSPRTRRVVGRHLEREEALIEIAVFETMHLGVGDGSQDRILQGVPAVEQEEQKEGEEEEEVVEVGVGMGKVEGDA